jgi:hypothetical protein
VRVWETGAAGAEALRALAAKASGSVERLAREDGAGGMVLCERGAAPDGVTDRQFTPLFSGGRHGPRAGDWVFRVGLWTPGEWGLHYLEDRAALDSRERKRSRATPWFKRLARNAWFDGAFERALCKRC